MRFWKPPLGGAWLVTALFALLALGSPSAKAQSYPNQTVRIIVPFSAGSMTDFLARLLADRLAASWQQTVIVENRPGVAGTVSAAKAAPDGYTLLLTSNGHVAANIVNKDVPFDPVNDFSSVSQLASAPLALIVPTALQAQNLAEFIALAKQKPGQLNFATAGLTSASFLSSEMFKQSAGIQIVHVPYKGTPEATTAILRGDVQMFFAPLPTAKGLAAEGKARILAVNTPERTPQLPGVQTVSETLPQFQYDTWFALLAPSSTSEATLNTVSKTVSSVWSAKDIASNIENQGILAVTSTPRAMDKKLHDDAKIYERLLSGAK